MTSKLVVNTIEADTGISSVSFASSISMSSTSKFHFSAAGVDIGADTNINRPAAGVLAFNINSSEKARIASDGKIGINQNTPTADLEIVGVAGTITTLFLNSATHNASVANESILKFGFNHSGSPDAVGYVKLIETSGNIFDGDMLFGVPYNTGSGGSATREALRIKSSGKVNIGDTQMSQNILNIEDGTAAALDIASHGSGGDTAYIGVKKSSGGGLTIGISNRDIIFKTGATYSNGTVFDSGTERARIHSNGDISCAGAADNNIYNDSSGGGINFKNGGQLVIVKQASSGADPLVWLNDTGQTTNKFLLFAQDGTEKASIGLAGNDLRFARDGYNETLRIRSDGKISTGTSINITNTYEFSVTGSDSNGAIYGHGRNHYLSNRSNAYASLTLKKSNSDSDAIDYLQLRDSSNNLKGQITGAGNWKPIAGGGIDFSITGHNSGMTSELLDDYEEGAYTPSTNTGLSLNSGYNTFAYIKIGRCCTVRGLFYPNNNPSGNYTMTFSLPFTAYNYPQIAGAGGSGVMYRYISGATAGVAVYVEDGGSIAKFYKNGSSNSTWSPVYNSDWNSAMEIYVDFTYFTV